jgi:molecular chaperone HtpG
LVSSSIKITDAVFARVDSDTIDKLVDKDESFESKLSKDQEKAVSSLIEKVADKEKFTVTFAALGEKDSPIIITRNEFMRTHAGDECHRGMSFAGPMQDHYNLVVNANHPLISKVLIEPEPMKQHQLIKQAVDLALLSQHLLKGEELTSFIQRSIELIG